MEHTQQFESDTAVEEREILLQRAGQVLASKDLEKTRVVRDQLRDYREQYQGDAALALVDETLRSLDSALGETSPDEYAYADNDPQ
jgi:hypothetical protein